MMLHESEKVAVIRPDSLKELIIAGTPFLVLVRGNAMCFKVAVTVGSTTHLLATFRGNVRRFKSIATVFRYLTDFGIHQFQVQNDRPNIQ